HPLFGSGILRASMILAIGLVTESVLERDGVSEIIRGLLTGRCAGSPPLRRTASAAARACGAVALSADQRHVGHAQGQVGLAVMLTGAEFACHAKLRTLRDVFPDLGEAVAPRAAIQPEGLFLVAETAVHGQRESGDLRV